jgi:putative YphP/YqiW family bacilliredoxin
LAMPYPESFIGPMRQELTRLGVQELRTADAVDALLNQKGKTIMLVVNSMCGCAAGKARPGIALALQHAVTPDVVATVFAGGDIEATARRCHPPRHPSAFFAMERYCTSCIDSRSKARAPTRSPGTSWRLSTACAPDLRILSAEIMGSKIARGLPNTFHELTTDDVA